MDTVTVRSASTGKYHLSYSASSITFCNASGQRRRPRITAASAEQIAKADASSFCRKCFPNGKPA